MGHSILFCSFLILDLSPPNWLLYVGSFGGGFVVCGFFLLVWFVVVVVFVLVSGEMFLLFCNTHFKYLQAFVFYGMAHTITLSCTVSPLLTLTPVANFSQVLGIIVLWILSSYRFNGKRK